MLYAFTYYYREEPKGNFCSTNNILKKGGTIATVQLIKRYSSSIYRVVPLPNRGIGCIVLCRRHCVSIHTSLSKQEYHLCYFGSDNSNDHISCSFISFGSCKVRMEDKFQIKSLICEDKGIVWNKYLYECFYLIIHVEIRRYEPLYINYVDSFFIVIDHLWNIITFHIKTHICMHSIYIIFLNANCYCFNILILNTLI